MHLMRGKDFIIIKIKYLNINTYLHIYIFVLEYTKYKLSCLGHSLKI